MAMRHIVICGLSDYIIFLHIYHKSHDFQEKLLNVNIHYHNLETTQINQI
jgi:hypothetical protein